MLAPLADHRDRSTPRADALTYRNYLVGLLALILAFNGVDRLGLGIALQDIKHDLRLSDTQLGVLTGIAFSIFYSLMGIPIARWADRGNRARIIALTTALWSATVALCGLARSLTQLLLIRVCVAVGEAGCIPSALSLISDHFSRSERPRAIAFYMQGVPLSLVVGYLAAGWLNQLYGWRFMFVAIGLPGIALALLAGCTLREPRLNRATGQGAREAPCTPGERVGTEHTDSPSLRCVAVTLWANRTFRHLLLFYSLMCLFNMGIVQWQPAFLLRSFQLRTGELGTWITLVSGLGLIAGNHLGGVLASRYAARDERLQLRGMAVAYAIVALASLLTYLSTSFFWAIAFIGLWSVAGTTTNGPLLAMVQALVPERMRATAMTLVLLFANLIGMGLGPLAVGALSDLLQRWTGSESLRYALLAMSPGYLWGAYHLLRAGRTVAGDLTRGSP